MAIQTYYCPHCGAEINLDENQTISICPNCGLSVGMDTVEEVEEPVVQQQETAVQNELPPVSGRSRSFVTYENVAVGTAFVPDNYEIDSFYEALWRSEMVPIYYGMKATREDHMIFMAVYSKEMFNDLRNIAIKGMLKLSEAHVNNGYQKFIDPDVYLVKEANRIAGVPLRLTARAKLPSPLGRNPEMARRLLDNDIYNFGMFVEVQPEKVSEYVDSVIYRFEGELNGSPVVTFAGMDYQGAELVYSLGLGGLFSGRKKAAKGNEPFGHSSQRVDHVMFGPQNLYFCMCYAEAEQEAQRDFLNFINSIQYDPSLREREIRMFERKFEIVRNQIARNNAITQQNLRNLQYNQQRLAQTLRDNSNAMSDMIMDSWNRKMASDSRISQARSEATMGVNTYTNSYGQNVDVSVVADHVYQNQYGDVYGVSGNEIDQDVLNRLNWTKLDK